MKTKQEIKEYFENGDIPNQEQFWEWQDSYWHKDEKIPSDKVDLDLSQKADLLGGKVPASQLPSYVDDVLEFVNLTAFPTTGEGGKIYLALDSNKLYRWSGSVYIDITPAEINNLRDLVDKGNYVGPKKWISFLYTGTDPNTGEGDRSGAIGVNSNTYSFFFGNMNPNHTGFYNTSFGYNSLPNLTTGQYNTVSGHFSARDLTTGASNTIMGVESGIGVTTGNDNTLIGASSGYNLKGGTGNSFLGKWSGCFITGGNNTFLGYQAGQFWGKGGSGLWSSNIVIGGGTSGHTNGIWGENNVIIGSNIELLGSNTNRFIVNNFLGKANRWYETHFIEGNFADKWLRFDTSLQVLRLPQADTTFTKNLVAKPDGTFGLEDKTSSECIPLTGTEPNKPVTGDILIKNNSGNTTISPNSVSCVDNTENGITIDYSKIKFLEAGSDIGDISNTGINTLGAEYQITCHATGARGLTRATDFTPNIKPLDYVQKKYVDKKSSYSDHEEITDGTWINGKPIYRKTVVYNAIPSNGEIDLTVDFRDMELIVSNQMFTEWYARDVAFAGNQWRGQTFLTLQLDMIKIEDVNSIDYSQIDSLTLTLEYTKNN
jgi:hypothetical protein